MTVLTKENVRMLRFEIENALNSLTSLKNGEIKFSIGTISFDANSLSCRLRADIVKFDETGNPIAKETETFLQRCGLYGLKPEALNFAFKGFDGNNYTLIGLNPRSKKYPFVVRRDDGKLFKMPSYTILNALPESMKK